MAAFNKLGSLLRHATLKNGASTGPVPAMHLLNAARNTSSKLFIRGLAWGTNDKRAVTEARVSDTETGRSRGSRIAEKRNIQDHKRRLLVAKYELRRNLYKAFCQDPDLPSDLRDKHRYKLSKLPRNSSMTRVRNRCIFTGRPRAVYERFRMSRIVFRGLASQGALMGIKKASW